MSGLNISVQHCSPIGNRINGDFPQNNLWGPKNKVWGEITVKKLRHSEKPIKTCSGGQDRRSFYRLGSTVVRNGHLYKCVYENSRTRYGSMCRNKFEPDRRVWKSEDY